MGKKKQRATQTSQGIHSCVANSTKRAMRREYLDSPDRMINQREAYDAGKRVMVTIANPNPNETNKRFIRVTAEQAGWKKNKR